jgi:hypothetical protein
MSGFLSGRTSLTSVATENLEDGAVTTAKIADVNVSTGKVADDAVTLAKMAPGTDGNLITYDASGNPAAVATGSSGQVLTSAGAGAAPTFATIASSPMVLIGSSAASNSSTLDITGLSTTYDVYYLIGSNLIPTTDASDRISLRVGDSSGYDSGASDYGWTVAAWDIAASPSAHSQGDVADSSIILSRDDSGVGSATGEGIDFEGVLFRPNSGTTYPTFVWRCYKHDNATGIYLNIGMGRRMSAITMDRCQLVIQDGSNINTGRFSVYGVKHA